MNAKFKVGDVITLIADTGLSMMCKGDKVRILLVDTSTMPYKVETLDRQHTLWITEDTAGKPTGWDNLTVGNVLIGSDGDKRTVLGVCGNIVFYSYISNTTSCYGYGSIEDLKNRNWKVEGDAVEEVIEELTMEEVCKALGKTVKIKK